MHEAAVALASDVLTLSPDETRRVFSQNLARLDEQIASMRAETAKLAPREYDPGMFLNLCLSVIERYYLTGDMGMLNEIISLLQEYLWPDPPESCDHPAYEDLIDSLATALEARYEQTMQDEDIMEAIELHKNSLMLRNSLQLDTSPARCGLGAAYYALLVANRTGYDDYFELALDNLRDALKVMPSSHPLRARTAVYHSLISNRNPEGDDASDISSSYDGENPLLKALTVARDALSCAPVGHPDYAFSIIVAGRMLHAFTALQTDPDAAQRRTIIQAMRSAPALIEFIHHPYYPASALSLNLALVRLPEVPKDPRSLEELVCQAREAWRNCNRSSVLVVMVAKDLVAALDEAYHCTKNLENLSEGIEVGRELTEFSPDHRPFLHDLAIALRERYLRTGSQDDLQEALELSPKCLSMNQIPPDVSEAGYLQLAGQLHADCFSVTGAMSDIDYANEYFESSIALVPSLEGAILNGVTNDVVEALHQRLTQMAEPIRGLEEPLSTGHGRRFSATLSTNTSRAALVTVFEDFLRRASDSMGKGKTPLCTGTNDVILSTGTLTKQTSVH
jgi:hypothetical protein